MESTNIGIEIKVVKKIKNEKKKEDDIEVILYWYRQINLFEIKNEKTIIIKRDVFNGYLQEIVNDGRYVVINEIGFEDDEVNTIDKIEITSQEGYQYLVIINGTIIIDELVGILKTHKTI